MFNDLTLVPRAFRHGRLLRLAGLCVALGVGLTLAAVLSARGAPAGVLLALGAVLGTMVWLAFRRPATGMEITGAEWRFFVGARHWRVPLSDIASVSVLHWTGRPPSVAITFLNGQTDILPDALAPDIAWLTDELQRRGVRVVG